MVRGARFDRIREVYGITLVLDAVFLFEGAPQDFGGAELSKAEGFGLLGIGDGHFALAGYVRKFHQIPGADAKGFQRERKGVRLYSTPEKTEPLVVPEQEAT